jgi:hypothetical protein
MSAMTLAAWCRACGVQLDLEAPACAVCGTALDPPVPGRDRIGRVVEVRGKLGHRNGISLRESGGGVDVLVKGDTPVEMSFQQYQGLRQVDVPGPAVIGEAGRLWKTLQAVNDGGLRGKWSLPVVEAAALSYAQQSVGSRRAAVQDAIALGLGDMAGQLGLPEPEVCWYRAVAAAIAGDTASAVGWLERLPAGAYAARVPLLMTRAADLLANPSLADRASVLLEPFTGSVPDAQALQAALGPVPAARVLELLVPFALSAENADGDLAAIASEIVELKRSGHPLPEALHAVRALGVYLEGRAGSAVDHEAKLLGILPTALTDQLIDRGVISPVLASQVAWEAADAAYLRCRLAPGAASDADVAAAGFDAEIARRAFLAGDTAMLTGLSVENPAVRHYQALARWSGSSTAEDLDGLRPEARHLLQLVGELRTAAMNGAAGVVREEVAADSSCWPMLRECALKGGLQLPDDLRVQYPRFGEWLELGNLQHLVFQGSWSEVISRGTALAARTALEVTSDEAKNMVAFAEFQQGRDAAALRLLDDALGGQYTTGLIVNASIVAASSGGSLAAMPYLARIVNTEPDPDVLRGAVQRAAELWMGDESSPEYPPILQHLVRRALSLPLSNDLLWMLLRLADHHDTAWLAADFPAGADPVHTGDLSQAHMLLYRRTWSRAKTEGRAEGLEHVAQVLVTLVPMTEQAPWAVAELQRFIKDLNDVIHVDFGEAIAFVATIDVLLAAGVFNPVEELVFAVQAGAHASVYLAEHNECIAPETEHRLLFETVRRFHERKSEMPEPVRDAAGEEVARCVSVSAEAMALVTSRQVDRFSPLWDELVRREQYDHQNRYAIIRQERQLLDNLDSYVIRVRAYVDCMQNLPLSSKGRESLARLTGSTGNWSAEIGRLRRML